jgi:hypothetical protein
MPQTKGQGQSHMTIDKEEGLGKVLAWHMNTVKVIFDKHQYFPQTYHFIDAYAGSGYNKKEQCDGSPLVYLKTVANSGIDSYGWFIEEDDRLSAELGMRVKGYERCEVSKGDNSIIVPQIARKLPKNAFGLIYADPNGIPDFDLLSKISRIPGLEKFDILIRYNSAAVKRNEHQTGGMKMLDHLNRIDKKYWIIRELRPGDIWQWTFLLGLNYGIREWKSQGFIKAITPEGINPGAIEIINKINYTKDERETLGGWQ